MRDPLDPGENDPLVIIVGIQHDGAAYQLDPRSRKRVEKVVPGQTLLRSVFLGHEREADFETLQPPRWETMARLLTGLTEEQLADQRGVVLYSPEREAVLWSWFVPADVILPEATPTSRRATAASPAGSRSARRRQRAN